MGVILTSVCFKLGSVGLQVLNRYFANKGKPCLATVKRLPTRSSTWLAPQGKANTSMLLHGHWVAEVAAQLLWEHLCKIVVKKWEILVKNIVDAFFLVVEHWKWSLVAPLEKLLHVGVQA